MCSDRKTPAQSVRGDQPGEVLSFKRDDSGSLLCAHNGGATRRRVLVLGGISEARALASRIAADPRLEGIVSLAGRTDAPLEYELPMRVGGFGGAEGLAQYLIEQRFERVVDATHPFAAKISVNARDACKTAQVPLLKLQRPAWRRAPDDRWTEVEDNAKAAHVLGDIPRRVFLTIGRQGVKAFGAAPQHDYLLRTIEPPLDQDLPPRCEVIFGRGPFNRSDEITLMREKGIDILVTKNSGGAHTYAKIEAARELGVEVVIIEPPICEGTEAAHDLDAAMAFLHS